MKAINQISPLEASPFKTDKLLKHLIIRKKAKRHSTCLAESAVCDFKQADEALSCGHEREHRSGHFTPHDKTLWNALIFWFVLHQGKMNKETLIFSSFCIKPK